MTKCVLLCDDEIDLLRPTEYALKRAGVEVICALDGERAWNLILERLPTVVVTDWQMPRLDGVQLVKRIRSRQQTCHLPVVMITAKYTELLETAETQNLQLSAVIAKPFSPRELSQRVEKIVEAGDIQATG